MAQGEERHKWEGHKGEWHRGSGTKGKGTRGSGTEGSGTRGSGTNGSGTRGSGTKGSGHPMYVLCMLAPTHIVSLEHCNVEGEELQWDDCEDALNAVHRARDRDGAVGALQTCLVIALADDDGAALLGGRGEWRVRAIEHAYIRNILYMHGVLPPLT